MSQQPYDSTQDTQQHINRVRGLLEQIVREFHRRGEVHDASKLQSPEKGMFDKYTPLLKAVTYGSGEYKAFLSQLAPALRHHYAHNSHHPEHYADGVSDMSLMDLLEMLADWKAAGERHADGSMDRSLEMNRTRFQISDELYGILRNTAECLGWLSSPHVHYWNYDGPFRTCACGASETMPSASAEN